MQKKSDLFVITKTRDLLGYILQITIKSPKALRYTFTNKIHNYALECLSLLVEANEHFLSPQTISIRRSLQDEATVKFKMLGYLCFLGSEHGAILLKQYQQISLQISECLQLLSAWKKSDTKVLKDN